MSLSAPQLKRFVRDFSAGFLDSPESDTLPLGATPDARNYILASIQEQGLGDEDGDQARAILRKRNGFTLVNPTAMASATEVKAVIDFQREIGASELLAVCNGDLFKWDGASSMSNLGGNWSTSAAVPINTLRFKNNVVIMDGTVMQRYNGTALFDMGQVKPTAAPGLATTGAGAITGTYEGYVVWYDSTMDHESSPSAVSAAVVFAAQQRRWTKPTGSPGSNYDKWRIYARRTDTNEVNFYKVGDVAIGTTTFDEQVSDTARVDAGAGPFSASNDPPPAFAFMGLYRDHGIGVKTDESYFYVSKQGDLESWHPSDKFAVERGMGKPLRSVTQYGTETVLCKPNKTFRLVGERLPLRIEPVHSEFGNVSQKSAMEIEGLLYAWDEQKGPYVTDLTTWRTLADNRIAETLAGVNREWSIDVQIEQVPDLNLVVWILSNVSTQRRRRLMLAYNYRLGRWCAPVTGLEFGSMARFITASEGVQLYVGDYWGRLYRMFSGESDGVPGTATLEAAVTSATNSTVTASGAAFYTTGNGMAGQRVLVKSPSGAYQWRRIQSNTSTEITLDTVNDVVWTTNPDVGWTVYCGAIEFYAWMRWEDFGVPEMLKIGRLLGIEGKTASDATVVEVMARFNGDESVVTTYNFTFPTTGGVWGQSQWGTGLWGARQRRIQEQRIGRSFFSMQVGFRSYRAGRAVDITAFGIKADPRRRKRVA